MPYLLKKLLIILFLNNLLSSPAFSNDLKSASLLILDKSASTKYELNFSDQFSFRDLTFELISCQQSYFDKYIDNIALIKIVHKSETYIGWFFQYTDELNFYSNKIYEISLISCSN